MLTSSLAPRRAQAERGFTMIEVMIGMLLLTVLIGGALYGVVRMSASNNELGDNRKAQRQSIDAIETIRQDINAARSPAMNRWNGTRDDLRDVAFHFVDETGNTDSRVMCANAHGTAYVSCLRAIVVAQPTELWLRAEARASTPGSECVGYSVDSKGLHRWISSSWRQCGPGLKTSPATVQTRLITANLSGIRDPFRYTLRYNSTPTGAPAIARNTAANLANCRTFSFPNSKSLLNANTRRASYITSVEINLAGVVTSRKGAAVTELKSSAPVTAHIGGEHVYAVGCSH
ncbi:MAG: type II secretion system protein [Gaiellales bacterium]